MVRAIQHSPTNNLQIIQRQTKALDKLRFDIGWKLRQVQSRLTPDELGELVVFVIENAASGYSETVLKARLTQIRKELLDGKRN